MDDLMLKFKLCKNTIRTYLKKGESMGLCCYNVKRKERKGKEKKVNEHSFGVRKKVEVFDRNMNSLGVFESSAYLEKHGEELFGEKLSNGLISLVCNRKRNHHKNLIFRFYEE